MIKYFTLLFSLFTVVNTFAQWQDIVIIDEYIIQVSKQTTKQELEKKLFVAFPNQHFKIKKISKSTNTYWLKTPQLKTVDLINLLSPTLLQLHQNSYLEIRNDPNIPNDNDFDQQWDMNVINAAKAWSITTGGITQKGDTIVVAVIDTGFDLNHEDIKENLWRNYAEIPNDEIDNDNNGFKDDFNGWVFIDSSDNHELRLHGTAVNGIIGAIGNNDIGVSGINWNVKIMMISGVLTVSDVIEAYDYILEMRKRYDATNGTEGAYVVATNLSLGISRAKAEDYPVWCEMYNQLGEVGILSAASTDNASVDVDEVGDMPTTCPSDYLISVTNTNQGDSLSANAAYGAVSVDLGAPGSGTYTISPGNAYNVFGGTSGASPHVAGAVALLHALPSTDFSSFSQASPKEAALLVKNQLLAGVNFKSSLQGKSVSEGRLNLFNSLILLERHFNPSENLAFSLYPNPVTNQLFIKYETYNKANLDVFIINALGQMVQEETFEVLNIGVQGYPIDLRKLQGGIYFLSVRQGDRFTTKRFLKVE